MKAVKKKHIIALVGLAALVLVGSTFAYWSQSSTIENPFDTGSYGSTVREDFDPSKGENWQPGVEIEKKVTAVNKGDTDLIVRARLDEKWVRKGETAAYKDSAAASGGYDVYTVDQVSPAAGQQANLADGLTAADKSIVTKKFSSSANWIKGTDGWYYYKVNLPGGQTPNATTDVWLESVEMLDNADMGKFETTKYVSASTDANEANWVWVVYTDNMPKYLTGPGATAQPSTVPTQYPVLHNKTETTYAKSGGVDLLGYSKSNYTLTVTVQTVQPTQEAINAMFGNGLTFTAPTGTTWTLRS